MPSKDTGEMPSNDFKEVQEPYGDCQFKSWFKCFSVSCVLLLDSRRNSRKQFIKHLWMHPQEVEERCLIFHAQLIHEEIIVTIEKSFVC